MGFFLEPNIKDVEPFETTMTGWFVLVTALDILDADTSQASGLNDGSEVSKETALSWANTLENAVRDKKLKKRPSEQTFSLTGTDLHELDKDWLSGFIVFLRSSGGFRQH